MESDKTKKPFIKKLSWEKLVFTYLGLVFFFFVVGDKKTAGFLIQIVFMSILGMLLGMIFIIPIYAFVCKELFDTEISEIIYWIIIIGSTIFMNLLPYFL